MVGDDISPIFHFNTHTTASPTTLPFAPSHPNLIELALT